MRTIVELPEEQILALAAIGERDKLSRAELLRRAVSEYVDRHGTQGEHQAFGIWASHAEDGLATQRRLRDEWPSSE